MSLRPLALVLIFALGVATAGPASRPVSAQAVGGMDLSSSDEPLEVTADEGIEWRRDEKVYIARGNARAARGGLSVTADVLTARYREGADGKIDVYSIEADGNVRMASADSVVTGDRAVYDIDKAVLLVTGDNLKAVTEKATVTARDSLEYWDKERVIVARGDAVAVEGDRRVEADVLTGYLRPAGDSSTAGGTGDGNANGGLYQVEADGNVLLTTAAEVVRASKAVYNLDKEIATLTGGVKITRGQNQLNGDYAEVNLKTGVSRLMGNPSASGGADGRVHTLIIPDRKPELGTP